VPDIVAYDPRTHARIAATVQEVERESKAGGPNPARVAPRGVNVQKIRITGASVVGPGGLACYPGVIENIDKATGVWSGSATTWLIESAGGALATRRYVGCEQVADAVTISGDTRPLFAVNNSGSAPWCLGPFLSGYTCVDNGDGTFTPTLTWSYAHWDGTTLTVNTTPCP
jgi:hypothetical protein